MSNYERISKIIELLNTYYVDNTKCYLDHETPWQLLIATILSAQCTDARVNIVTKTLFEKYTSVEAFANADIIELEKDVKTTGFYRNKANHIKACCSKLLTDFGGEVPSEIDLLTSLPGVGRKTANVIRGNIYEIESIVVDTHVKRLSKKLGLTVHEDPTKIEFDLMEVLPKEVWIRYNTQIIAHGRAICTARNPKCSQCFLLGHCPWGQENVVYQSSKHKTEDKK
ncbi:MAG: endonuclease III [Firmicutes bacterium HGW-Firmicutes-1]|nr:MAG: endonuclease III [Firmicutes bacterium HGW-Firmicutes-1]